MATGRNGGVGGLRSRAHRGSWRPALAPVLPSVVGTGRDRGPHTARRPGHSTAFCHQVRRGLGRGRGAPLRTVSQNRVTPPPALRLARAPPPLNQETQSETVLLFTPRFSLHPPDRFEVTVTLPNKPGLRDPSWREKLNQ